MDAAGVELAELDGLSVAELKALLREKHATLLIQSEQLLTQSEQLAVKDAQILSYTAQIEAFKLHILKLRQMQFGKRSERYAHQIAQLELWVEELETAVADRSRVLDKQTAVKHTASVPKSRREFPPHLPRETQTIVPHESDCPDCGCLLYTSPSPRDG